MTENKSAEWAAYYEKLRERPPRRTLITALDRFGPGGAGSLPYGMAVDDQDRIWVAETGPTMPNKLVSFNTKTRAFEHNIPIGDDKTPNSIRHMQFDPATKMIWFGQDRGFIGSIKLPTVVVP